MDELTSELDNVMLPRIRQYSLGDILSKEDKDWASKPDIKWNFTKFLVNKNGEVAERFEPTADMKKIEEKIVKLL
jgi:glutathione peroxidase